MDIDFKDSIENKNPELKKVITKSPEAKLQTMVVEYVGEKINPEDDAVTVEMIVEVLTQEFPELVLALAEENWIRGYHQALDDVESGKKLMEQENDAKQEKNKLS